MAGFPDSISVLLDGMVNAPGPMITLTWLGLLYPPFRTNSEQEAY